jgi:hypothetical protein
LSAFQRALSDLVASPRLCLLVRSEPARHLSRYQLSPRERRRLEAIVWQRGMSTNCTLYRINRITPLYTLLPLSCHLLADRLVGLAERFWDECGYAHPEFSPEIERFAQFLLERLSAGHVEDPFLDEVLHFELAVNQLHFLPRRQIKQQLDAQRGAQGDQIRVNPLIRLIAFRHEPLPLLEALAERRSPPEQLIRGEFFVILDATGENFALRFVDSADAAILRELDEGGSVRAEYDERLGALRQAELIVGT